MINRKLALRNILALTTGIGLAMPAYAQDAAPPARVGQVAGVSGSVSYNGAGSNGAWVAATPNYPVAAGDSLFTQAGAQAAVVLDSSRIALAPNTEMQITALDDNNFTATESQGEVFLTLTDLRPGQTFVVNTPRGAVSIAQNGEYDVAAGDANDPTTLSVLEGAATIGGVEVPAGQAGILAGTGQDTGQLGPVRRDAFMTAVLAQMPPPPPPYAPPVVQQMTGVGELSRYGSWDQSPDYGAVWYPNVSADWAPYRDGHWAYVAPWGWTCVDVEPWGFAPFHYGRWIDGGGRWGWVPAAAYAPGDYEQPVYAPAVVGFFGLGAGVAITAAILASGNVGWLPLGPNEAYYPGYHADPDYLRRMNHGDVRNFAGGQPVPFDHYANRRAATYIPAADMARGAAVGHFGHPLQPGMFAQARPAGQIFNQAVRPNYAPPHAAAPHPTDFARGHGVGPGAVREPGGEPGALGRQPVSAGVARPQALPHVVVPQALQHVVPQALPHVVPQDHAQQIERPATPGQPLRPIVQPAVPGHLATPAGVARPLAPERAPQAQGQPFHPQVQQARPPVQVPRAVPEVRPQLQMQRPQMSAPRPMPEMNHAPMAQAPRPPAAPRPAAPPHQEEHAPPQHP